MSERFRRQRRGTDDVGCAPLLSAAIEMIMDGLRVTGRWAAGAAFGLVGMVLLCIAESSGHGVVAAAPSTTLGVGLGLLAGLTYALYSWAARRLMQRRIPATAAMGTIFGIGGKADRLIRHASHRRYQPTAIQHLGPGPVDPHDQIEDLVLSLGSGQPIIHHGPSHGVLLDVDGQRAV